MMLPILTTPTIRDELLITLSGRESHRWNEYLDLSVTAEVTLNHIVYLLAVTGAGTTTGTESFV